MMRIEKRAWVRTTVSIDDEILEKARREAEGQGVSLSHLVNQALAQTLAKAASRSPSQPFRMLTFQGDEAPTGLDLTPVAVARLRDGEAI